MKMTDLQLKALGYCESSPGVYARTNTIPPSVKDAVAACEINKSATELRVNQAHPKRIRQSSKPLMNGLEQEWFTELNNRYPSRYFLAQCIKFRLGNGIVYTPDIFNFSDFSFPTAWEVKGKFAHRGGFENLKVAAAKYPRIHWVLVWKEGTKWNEQTVLP